MNGILSSMSLCSYLFFFFLCICQDFRRKTISLSVLFLLVLLGIPSFVMRLLQMENPCSACSIAMLMASFLPGLLLVILSCFTEEALGLGDGYFFLASGCYIPAGSLSLMLLSGILTSGLVSMGLMTYGKWKGRSLKQKRIPFLPCLLPAMPVILAAFSVG